CPPYSFTTTESASRLDVDETRGSSSEQHSQATNKQTLLEINAAEQFSGRFLIVFTYKEAILTNTHNDTTYTEKELSIIRFDVLVQFLACVCINKFGCPVKLGPLAEEIKFAKNPLGSRSACETAIVLGQLAS